MDTTATKHRNEDFFKELDKDRREKHCEYAVLVSMLEADNDYYNDGIVDVSYRYPKMYVIRPQFFLAMISLLRNAALSSLELRRQIAEYEHENVDWINFQAQIDEFKETAYYNYDLANRKLQEALDGIDKTMAQLQKVKDALTSSARNWKVLNDKSSALSLERLAKKSPSVRELIAESKI